MRLKRMILNRWISRCRFSCSLGFLYKFIFRETNRSLLWNSLMVSIVLHSLCCTGTYRFLKLGLLHSPRPTQISWDHTVRGWSCRRIVYIPWSLRWRVISTHDEIFWDGVGWFMLSGVRVVHVRMLRSLIWLEPFETRFLFARVSTLP